MPRAGSARDPIPGPLAGLRGQVDRTLVYANNHYAGRAPATIDQLGELLDG